MVAAWTRDRNARKSAAICVLAGRGEQADTVAYLGHGLGGDLAGDTVAVDPNGLDAPGQHTSAYDLALFARRDRPGGSFVVPAVPGRTVGCDGRRSRYPGDPR